MNEADIINLLRQDNEFMRVARGIDSQDKQGLDGDSLETQREQGEAYAKAHNIIITGTIILLESASHKTQPMQKVIDVCKDKSKGFQVVACPKCGKTLSGSASRDKMGAYYPAYHCSRDGHYFRVPKPEFDKTLEDFVRTITVKPEYVDDIIAAIAELWRERQAKQLEANQQRLEHRQSLQNQIRATVDRMRVVTSETALAYLEEDIVNAENELEELDKEITNQPNLQAEFDQVLQYAKYILEHLSELLPDLCNPLRKAAFFAAIFNKVPTYDEIKFGTHKNSSLPEVNELFRIRVDDKSFDGDLTGNRTPIARMKTWCPDR